MAEAERHETDFTTSRQQHPFPQDGAGPTGRGSDLPPAPSLEERRERLRRELSVLSRRLEELPQELPERLDTQAEHVLSDAIALLGRMTAKRLRRRGLVPAIWDDDVAWTLTDRHGRRFEVTASEAMLGDAAHALWQRLGIGPHDRRWLPSINRDYERIVDGGRSDSQRIREKIERQLRREGADLDDARESGLFNAREQQILRDVGLALHDIDTEATDEDGVLAVASTTNVQNEVISRLDSEYEIQALSSRLSPRSQLALRDIVEGLPAKSEADRKARQRTLAALRQP